MVNKSRVLFSGHTVILFFMLLILVKLILLVIIIVKADNVITTQVKVDKETIRESTNDEAENGDGEEEEEEDYYSSLIGVQNLAKKEQEIVKMLTDYRQKLQERLELVDLYETKQYDIQSILRNSKNPWTGHKKEKYPLFDTQDALDWVSEQISANPLLVFKLLRRFKKELTDIADVLNRDVDAEAENFLQTLEKSFSLPKLNDIEGAADGLLRLQEAYQLSTYEMAKGILIERTGCKLLASDLFFIGSRAFSMGLYATSIEWLFLAYQKVLQENDDKILQNIIEDNLQYIVETHNKELLSFKPAIYSNLFVNLVYSNFSNVPRLYINPPVKEYPIGSTNDSIHDIFNFYALCRGEKLTPPNATKDLRCWLSSEHTPFNILAPLKFELLHENPPVFQVYDLLSDHIIESIKKRAIPHLKRAKIVGTKKNGSHSDVRTSAAAWIADTDADETDDQEDKIFRKIPSIVNGATGLECDSASAAEELQVSCYGSVGGYYVPHLDALNDPRIPEELSFKNSDDAIRGDRVATVMFYLTDVKLGGGTAFPRLGVAARPIKGSAVIWYNLLKNGQRDLLTLHGGCPVVLGNKWVANKWIRLHDQFNVRKCSRNQHE